MTPANDLFPSTGWAMSPSIGELVKALAKAQLSFDPVLKDSDNPAFRSKYADLASVIGATQPHLAKEGLVIVQMPHAKFADEDSKQLTITTLMAHSSGEWLSSDLTLPAMMRERFDAQSVGSAITYGRRYAYSAMTGVAPEPDDDGNKAAGIGSKDAAKAVATDKIKKAAGGDESVSIVAWKEGMLALSGNGLAIVRANLTESEKIALSVKYDGQNKVYTIPEAQGNQFAGLCEKYKVEVKWQA